MSGPVRVMYEVDIDLTQKQADELRRALAIVCLYEKTAKKACRVFNEDWSMCGYAVKNDKVIVTVEAGACG